VRFVAEPVADWAIDLMRDRPVEGPRLPMSWSAPDEQADAVHLFVCQRGRSKMSYPERMFGL
jgi:hypothetical protein